MLQALRKRIDREEEGFTLIELMVVVLIIGILLAIAVPTFLKAQENAKSKAATSNLRSGLSAAKTVYADVQTYDSATAVTAGALTNAEPSLKWTTGGSTGPQEISFVGTINEMALANRSTHGFCYYIVDNVDPTSANVGTKYAKSTAGGNASCTASAAPTGTGGLQASPSLAKW